jgi:hypothetical protein
MSNHLEGDRSVSGMQRILAERKRQIETEGYAAAHDDEHRGGEMFSAALCYQCNADFGLPLTVDGVPTGWPWGREWWKPKTPERDLERAGVLYLAEAERLKRLGEPTVHIDRLVDRIAARLDAMAATSPQS